MIDPSLPRAPSAGPARLLLQWALALGGLAIFVYLVLSSGITLSLLERLGWQGFGLLILIAGGSQILDTIGWFYAVRHVVRPTATPFFAIRVAGDALTNALPGGVVLGETYKAALMRRLYGVSLADNAATLLTAKFGLAFSQAVFILGGLSLCHGVLRDRGPVVFGIQGAELIALALTVGFATLLGLPLFFMARGHAFGGTLRAIGRLPIPPLRRAIERNQSRIASLDRACTQVLRGNRGNLLCAFVAYLGGWLIAVLESYVLLTMLGVSQSLRVAFVMESVGSIFRMIFFFVPSGIGAQDASYAALFKLYGFSSAPAGAFVLLKRCKELVWIGIGLVLLLCLRRTAPSVARQLAPAVEARPE